MPWVRFDDGFDDSDDIDAMSTDAIALNLCATTWSSRNLKDGFIPDARVPKLPGGNPAAVAELCAGDLPWWVRVDGGYQIRSFLKYNPSAEDVKKQREEISKARSEAGRKGMEKRWGNRQGEDNKHNKPNNKNSDLLLTNDNKGITPYPVSRIPESRVPVSRIPKDRDGPKTGEVGSTHGVLTNADERFEAFAREYPKRDGDLCKAEAKRKHGKRFADAAFAQTCIDAAIRYRLHCDHCNKTRTDKVAQMTTWLNQSRWTEPYEIMNGKLTMVEDRDRILEGMNAKQ